MSDAVERLGMGESKLEPVTEEKTGNYTYDCDRCGDNAINRGELPDGQGESYRFCSGCWSDLHTWVEEGQA